MGSNSTKVQLPQSKVEEAIVDLKKKGPIISVTVKCFHHEEVLHRNTDGKVVRTEKVKKVTHTETEQFSFDEFEDLSPTLFLPHLTVDKPLVAITLQLNVQPSDAHSKEQLTKFQQSLVDRNKSRDKFLESEIKYSLPGVDNNTKLVIFSDQFKEAPSDMFGNKTSKVTYKIDKKFTVKSSMFQQQPQHFPQQNPGYPPQQQLPYLPQQQLPYSPQQPFPYQLQPPLPYSPQLVSPYPAQQTHPYPPAYKAEQNPPAYMAEQNPPPYMAEQHPPPYTPEQYSAPNKTAEQNPPANPPDQTAPSAPPSHSLSSQQSQENDWEFL